MICSLIHVEIDRTDDGGFVGIVIELGTDAVLHVSNSFDTRDQADAAARDWIDRNE